VVSMPQLTANLASQLANAADGLIGERVQPIALRLEMPHGSDFVLNVHGLFMSVNNTTLAIYVHKCNSRD